MRCSFREFQVPKEYSKIIQNRLVVSVDIKPKKRGQRRSCSIVNTQCKLFTDKCLFTIHKL